MASPVRALALLLTGIAPAAAVTVAEAQESGTAAAAVVYQYGTVPDRTCAGGESGWFVTTSGQTDATASASCTFSGPLTTSGMASSVAGGDLKARTTVSGTLGANQWITADAFSVYRNQVTITGSLTPASVIFHASIHGTAVGVNGGAGWNNNMYQGVAAGERIAGRLEFGTWNRDSEGNRTTFVPYANLDHHGDGSTRHGSWQVGWDDFAYSNSLLYQMTLVAFARPFTQDAAADVYLDSDFSSTARLASVQVLDAAGNDITSQMQVSFAADPASTVPEPVSMALLGTGLAGLGAVRRRRRKEE